ncbi:MAG: winged helix-turn-helix domain-containing protein [Ruminococcus sp.]|nr:winged helix-turn-helix domain-containing protein [Ruminococcus sp.]
MIYCVEDDKAIRDLMIYTLNSTGFEVQGFNDGKELDEALKISIPKLIILDIMLPGDDGITILKKLRSNSNTADIPIIIASAKGTEYDKVIGLDLGADDYLAKPFGMMEMVSRVKAILRRTQRKISSAVIKIGQLEMDTAKHIVTVSGKRIELTFKEYELLHTFMTNIDTAFSREQLLDNLWGSDFLGETRTVDVHIGTLRSKLGNCAKYIRTVRGVGYRMEEIE